MKRLSFAIALVISGTALAREMKTPPPHLDLEMTSAEYRIHLEKMKKSKSSSKFSKDAGEGIELDDPAITSTLKLGMRLSSWITKVNMARTPETAIRLTSATTRSGVPIDKPSIYSPSIIKQKVQDILAAMPEAMRTIVTSTGDLPDTIPVADDVFIKNGRALDRQYQSAARFKSLDQWRSAYIQRAKQDVRGLYYLNTNKITATELETPDQLPADKLNDIKDALVKVCFNNNWATVDSCKRELDNAFANVTVAAFYNKYIAASKQIWADFFVIPNGASRSDVEWNGQVATVPFFLPSIAKFIPYLQNNIEDEYRWNGWGLKMNFGLSEDAPHLVFQAGVVPHVNGLGGNEIVMDSNQPIEEYESQWTIRHEFGHVLGLPDCYHEFYDTNLKAYVNYQLDITDLMCSRAGNMNERIYLELKKAYEP